MMQAFAYDDFGGPEVCTVRTLPIPTPKSGQVRVRVHAAALNPVDFKRRSGVMKMLVSEEFPVTVGYDGAGIIDAIGPDVSPDIKVGDSVYLRTTIDTSGTFADYCLTEVGTMARLPTGVSFVDAAAVPLAAMTALQMLRKAGFKSGDEVLINAGAGGVGHFAIQLAKAGGASKVVATASAKKHDFLRSIGADECIDYAAGDYVAEFKRSGRLFDVCLDNVSESAAMIGITKEGGAVISSSIGFTAEDFAEVGITANFVVRGYLWFSGRSLFSAAKAAKVRFAAMFLKPNAADLHELTGLMERGLLRPHVNVFKGIDKAAEAVALIESGRATGKVVLDLSP